MAKVTEKTVIDELLELLAECDQNSQVPCIDADKWIAKLKPQLPIRPVHLQPVDANLRRALWLLYQKTDDLKLDCSRNQEMELLKLWKWVFRNVPKETIV